MSHNSLPMALKILQEVGVTSMRSAGVYSMCMLLTLLQFSSELVNIYMKK